MGREIPRVQPSRGWEYRQILWKYTKFLINSNDPKYTLTLCPWKVHLSPGSCLLQGALAERGHGHTSDTHCRHRTVPSPGFQLNVHVSFPTYTQMDWIQGQDFPYVILHGQLMFYTLPGPEGPFQILISVHRWFVGRQEKVQHNDMQLGPFAGERPLWSHQALIMYVALLESNTTFTNPRWRAL